MPKDFSFPVFSCPDETLNTTYRYRAQLFLKHLHHTAQGWVITEFLPDVPWAGKYNTISCAASHHVREGRWLSSPQVTADYLRFWAGCGDHARQYSFPLADTAREYALVTGDRRTVEVLYPALCANHAAWRDHRRAGGLYYQIDNYDGMEFSVSGNGLRPSINAYQYADAAALAQIAGWLGRGDEAAAFGREAQTLAGQINARLWNAPRGFYETLYEDGTHAGARELIGYIPWIYRIPPAGREGAFRKLWEPQGFFGEYGPTTVERCHPGYGQPFDHECLWNGPSWPFATTQVLSAMISLLQHYPPQQAVAAADFMRLLTIYAASHRDAQGRPYLNEDLDPDTGRWVARDRLYELERDDRDRGDHYNHSAFIDLIVRGLCGVCPAEGDALSVHSLSGGMPFDLSGVPYHGHTLRVVREADTLSAEVDGRCRARATGDRLTLHL